MNATVTVKATIIDGMDANWFNFDIAIGLFGYNLAAGARQNALNFE